MEFEFISINQCNIDSKGDKVFDFIIAKPQPIGEIKLTVRLIGQSDECETIYYKNNEAFSPDKQTQIKTRCENLLEMGIIITQ